MAKNHRPEKLAGEIRRIVGELLIRDLKDPRLHEGMVSITEVEVSNDGSYATLYISALNTNTDPEAAESYRKGIIDAFSSASGHIRKEIGKRVKVRFVPELRFKFDTSLDYAEHMSAVLDRLKVSTGDEEASADDDESHMEADQTEDIDAPEETEESDDEVNIMTGADDRYFKNYAERYHFSPNPDFDYDVRREDMLAVTNELLMADSIYIFPHYVADGDAIGSACAMCRVLRKLGKQADILMEDETPDDLQFMDKGYIKFVTEDEELPQRDLSLAVDCSNVDRFPKREKIFFKAGKRNACIDHHTSNDNFANVNLVDPGASATAELLYELFSFMGVELDKEIGEALYAGIVTDTGNFQYTNTTKKTHMITAKLYDLGIDTKTENIILFQSERMEKLKLHATIMNNLTSFCDGRATMAYVTLEMYEACNAKTSESDGMNGKLRDIKGVEVAVFLREKTPDEVKVGFRSKDYFDVAKLCERLGGGGHVHAAGCTVKKTMEETIPFIRKMVEEEMAKYDARRGMSEE